jgi:hypothetical protein
MKETNQTNESILKKYKKFLSGIISSRKENDTGSKRQCKHCLFWHPVDDIFGRCSWIDDLETVTKGSFACCKFKARKREKDEPALKLIDKFELLLLYNQPKNFYVAKLPSLSRAVGYGTTKEQALARLFDTVGIQYFRKWSEAENHEGGEDDNQEA